MKTLALLAAALLIAGPSFAQDFFGMSPEDAQAMIGQVKAAERLQRLKDLGQAPSAIVAPVSKALGYTKTLSSRQDCILTAVEARMGIARLAEGTEYPDVLYASETDAAHYRAAVKVQYPGAKPGDVESVYLSDFNVIYLNDSASAYRKGGTLDGSLAGQYARFLDSTQRDVRDEARLDADAAAAAAWYDSQYPSGRSSCAD
jgi:hypothetical protein